MTAGERALLLGVFSAALGVFFPLTSSTEFAALAMSGSSLFLAENALLLKRAHIEGLK